MSLHRIDRSLAAVLPYGHFVDDGEIYLRGKGLMVGYEMHGMSIELRFRKYPEQRCLTHLRQPDDSSLHKTLRFADWVSCRSMKRANERYVYHAPRASRI